MTDTASPQPAALASTTLEPRGAGRSKSMCPSCGQPPRPKRPRNDTTDEQYRKSISRLIANYSRRIADGGRQCWPTWWRCETMMNKVIAAAVDDCGGETWNESWAEIGEATAMTPRGAQQRRGSRRRPQAGGGQPSSLR